MSDVSQMSKLGVSILFFFSTLKTMQHRIPPRSFQFSTKHIYLRSSRIIDYESLFDHTFLVLFDSSARQL